jgi:LPS-assembly protein
MKIEIPGISYNFSLFAALICSGCISWGSSPFQSARIQGISLQADSLYQDSVAELVELSGHVQIIYQNQHLKCDRAKISLRSKSVDAQGDVLVTTPEANIGGDHIILDLESNSGLIFNGYVQSGTVLFEGSLITKTSDVDYIANDAKYTACTTCPEAWSFSGTKIRAELGGYAYIKSSLLKFGGVPVFWMPYLVVPLKSDRQTGLLTPSIESENPGGLILAQPFFWAISRSQDATITLKNYELRGLKSLLEYNYMLNSQSYGTLNTAFLHDKVFGTEDRINNFRTNKDRNNILNRWFINYEHYYDLPEGYINRVQFNNVSDLQYPKDFSSEEKGNMDPALENRVSVTKNDLSQHFSIDASYYLNLLQSDPMAGNNDAVHRIPEIKYSHTLTKIGSSDVLYSFDVDYVNFVRAGNGYDDLNSAYAAGTINNRYVENNCSNPYYSDSAGCRQIHDGTYNPNKDLIRTGQRLDFQPSLYRPFQLGSAIDILPKITYRETDYNFGFGEHSQISRKYLRAEISAKFTMSQVFGDLANLQGTRLKHEIQPEITATTIPWYEQPNHPFFGSTQYGDVPSSNQQFVSDNDLNSPFGLQFDYNDRVFERKLVTLGFTNKLTRKTWVNDRPEYLQFFSWRLAQAYDVYQAEKTDSRSQPFSDVLSDLRLTLNNFQFSQQLNYYPYQQVTNSDSNFRLYNDRGDAAALRYLNQFKITPGQEVDRGSRTEEYKFTVRNYHKHADLIGTTVLNANPPNQANRFKLWAYGVELKIPGDCSSIQIYDKIEDGKREQKVQFGFVWDGQAKSTFINKLSADQPFGI